MDLGEKFLETVFLSQVQEVWSSLARCCLAKQMVGNLRPSFLNVEKKKTLKIDDWPLSNCKKSSLPFLIFFFFFCLSRLKRWITGNWRKHHGVQGPCCGEYFFIVNSFYIFYYLFLYLVSFSNSILTDNVEGNYLHP